MILSRSSERSAGSFSGTVVNVVAFGRGDLGTRVRLALVLTVPVSRSEVSLLLNQAKDFKFTSFMGRSSLKRSLLTTIADRYGFFYPNLEFCSVNRVKSSAI